LVPRLGDKKERCTKNKDYRSGLNERFYESDEERWKEINKIKEKVAEHLRVPQGSWVLDVLVGEADFARAAARNSEGSLVVAGEILDSDLKEARRRVEHDGLKRRIELLRMDITCMAFMNDSFDYVVNFTGWEDFTAVSGEKLVGTAFSEIVRVLKPDGVLALTFIPALDRKDRISSKDDELHEYMYESGKKPKYYSEQFFLRTLKKHRMGILRRSVFETPKSRLKPEDAEKYIKWICENYRGFYASDVKMREYEGIMRKFGAFIERYGIRERRSEFILLIAQKVIKGNGN
jgi:ubiquinone/menaquinone biosynthesis C-methylase UbiE